MFRPFSELCSLAYDHHRDLILLGLLQYLLSALIVVQALVYGIEFSKLPKSLENDAFLGVVLVSIGSAARALGRHGLVDAQVILDPWEARKNLEPYMRMVGGTLQDALDAADSNASGNSERVTMVVCPACGKLNEEDSRFCQECGAKL